jgi:hypothetical protein
MTGFHDQMSYTPPPAKAVKEEKFDDIIHSLVNVLITDEEKINYITAITRNNAKGIIMAEAKNKFLRRKFGKIKHPVYDSTGKLTGYEYREFDRTLSETMIKSALSLYPAVTGKRAEMIADMLKSTASEASQQHLASKLFGNMQGNNIFRR